MGWKPPEGGELGICGMKPLTPLGGGVGGGSKRAQGAHVVGEGPSGTGGRSITGLKHGGRITKFMGLTVGLVYTQG